MPDDDVKDQKDSSQEPDALDTKVDEPPKEPDPKEVKQFDEAYVKDLRVESAKYRKRAQDAEGKLKEHDQSQMGELEKAQSIAADSEKRVEQLTNLLTAERTRNAVTLEATKLKFRDPSDALAMIDVSELNFDEETGRPTTKSVKGALERLVKEKAYLVGDDNQGPLCISKYGL